MSHEDPKSRKEYFKEYRERNKERYKLYMRRWRVKQRKKMVDNPEYAKRLRAMRLKAFRKWYEKNKDLHRERNREYARRKFGWKQECLNPKYDLSAKS